MKRGARDALFGALLLAAPATAVIAWNLAFPDPPYNYAIFDFARNTFAKCAPLPELNRTVRCDVFVKYWEGCQKSENGCKIEETHKVLTRLDFDPPSLHLDIKGLKPLR